MTKDTHANGGARRPQTADIQRGIAEAQRHKKAAAEASGFHGHAVQQFCDNWNVERKAFNWTRQLADMDSAKRDVVLNDFLDLVEKMGFTAQRDMFAGEGEQLDERVAAAKTGKGKRGRKADEPVSDADKAAALKAAADRLADETADGARILDRKFEDQVSDALGVH